MDSNQKAPTRGKLSQSFLKKLTEGEYAPLLQSLRKDKELDIQLRDNYINVYYRGGNILLLRPKSFDFDKFYFYRRQTGSQPFPKSYVEKVARGKRNEISKQPKFPIPTIEETKEILKQLDSEKEKLKSLLNIINTDNTTQYLQRAKQIMDKWFESWKKQERNDQHYIAVSNREFSEKSNLVVVDLEFAVSRLQPYNHATNEHGTRKTCRFDIIAVDKRGQIYVIELKQNEDADAEDNKANVKVHSADFYNTIGNDLGQSFVTEISGIVEAKKELDILPREIIVNKTMQPIFAVAFCGKNPESFNSKYANERITVINVIHENNEHLYLKL